MIPAESLISKFQLAITEQWGYIYGTTHEIWTEAKQKAYARQYQGDSDRENSVLYGGKWDGHWVTDCSGLFKWAFAKLGGSIAHGSNSIWDRFCSAQGNLNRGSRTDGQTLKPGTAVFTSSGERHNHIGLYIGNGTVIEAQRCEAGVVMSKIANKKWTCWGELKNVSYTSGRDDKKEPEGETMNMIVVLPAGATGSTVNMRSGPDASKGLVMRVPVGAVVEVLEDRGTWCKISYQGKTGWMMSNYLEYEGQGGESGGSEISDEDMAAIEDALQSIEKQIEAIRSRLGRG